MERRMFGITLRDGKRNEQRTKMELSGVHCKNKGEMNKQDPGNQEWEKEGWETAKKMGRLHPDDS